ncbi:TVP38/TMEM64 family protein [Ammoniphilus sp. YIM 78166]|uniref:TVP38/TMEM64 family protein n=1 Tax=Ammoniphilus sp. YIM 78166 TaxID=1644106 RepID=UPI00106F57A1|nr:TVP38/TMEM64 family protein [Ammoniphilus sp. YIM 78166]
MNRKLALTFFYLLIGFLIYQYAESILSWFQSSTQPGLTMVLATGMALFPVIPYPIIGGLIGAAYGPAMGGIITWFGSSVASILMFLFVRYGYQDWGLKILHRYKGLAKVTDLYEDNAFLMILFSRMLPFIPSIIINVYSALSRVSFLSYAIASSLGKVPAMLLFALIGNNLVTDSRNLFITLTIYGGFLAVTLSCYYWWKKKRHA